MLTAISTRWQLVLERYDETTLYLSKGAPRRWYIPSSGGFSVTNAATRFGQVSFNITNTITVQGGESSIANVILNPWKGLVFGASLNLVAIRLRSSIMSQTLDSASVIISGDATLSSVDALSNLIYVIPTKVTSMSSFIISANFS
jgi:hypothetical protein